MIIGIPKEIKTHEYRVAITPAGVSELKAEGHELIVEKSAGEGSGFSDSDYQEAGASIMDAGSLFARAGLIVKVKEPIRSEYALYRKGQALFTFLHLAPNKELIDILLDKEISAFGYETLEVEGKLPLLMPMSEIAGRMSPLVAAYFLQKVHAGAGILPTGATGAPPANILILGAGIVGTNAAQISHALGMRVTVLNRGLDKLKKLDSMFGGSINTLSATAENIEEQIKISDIVIGAVLVTGERAPLLVTRDMISSMKKGSVIVDVAVDQGGCFETTRPTTHDNPIYEISGIIHYAVANMPGAYPRTSTLALTGSALPYVKRLASMGLERAVKDDPPLRSALNTHKGKIVHKGLALSVGIPTEGS